MQLKHWKLYWLVLFAAANFQLSAQNQRFQFESVSAVSNLSQSTVTCILQDRKGFLWLGTWSGLGRFDGYTVRLFNQGNSKLAGLDGNKITCLYEDPDGELWVGTRNTGLYRFDRSKERFETIQTALGAAEALPAQNITSVFKDQNRRLWIGTEDGLYYFDERSKRFVAVPLQVQTPPPSQNIYLYSIVQTPDKAIWVSGSHGLFRATGNAAHPEFRQIPLHPAGKNESAQSIEFHNFVYCTQVSRQHPDVLWVGTKNGLKKVQMVAGNPDAPRITPYTHESTNPNSLSHNFVVDICETDFPAPNTLWLATFNGLNTLTWDNGPSGQDRTPVCRQFFTDAGQPQGLHSNIIRSLYSDRTGILWIGTDRGLNKLDPHSSNFTLHQLKQSGKMASDLVSHISVTNDAIWSGTFGGGIFKTPLVSGVPEWHATVHYYLADKHNSPVSDFISAVLPDDRGNIWVVTQGAGVFRVHERDFPPNGGKVPQVEQFSKGSTPQSIGDDYVMCGQVATDGRIWFGTWDSGLNVFDPVGNRMMRFPGTSDGKVDFRRSPVVAILESNGAETGSGNFWVGTRGGGLFLIHFEEASSEIKLLRHFSTESAPGALLSHNSITSILRDRSGKVWFPNEHGLDYWDNTGKTLAHLPGSENLPSSIVQTIIEDGQHRYWVSTQSGIANFQSKKPEGWTFTTYQNRNGLHDNFFNCGAVAVLPDGKILFGGNNGITEFNPSEVQPDTNPPNTSLIGLRLFNRAVLPGIPTKEGFVLEKSLTESSRLVLSHRDNVVSFEFTSLHFSCPEQNRFAYKLEGFDPDWTYTDASQRLAHYTNLPSGDYVFMLKSANSDGVWNQNVVRLALTVRPPWWQSAWAYSLYFFILTGIIYGVIRIQVLRATYLHQIQIERLEKQKLEELNQMKLSFFTNISHELKTPLTLIISPLEDLIRDRSAATGAWHHVFLRMHRNGMRLLTMINQLLDIRKAEAGLMKLDTGEGNVVQLVDEICLSFREMARHKNIQFSFHAEQPVIRAWFDPDYLEKVLFNLLSNAFKFTQAEGKIEVTVGNAPEDRRFFVRIADNGKGIPAEKLPYIFDQFYQVEAHYETGSEGGSGIGLSLVKTIIERHHGSVEVSSEPGKGSVFTVWLPLGDAHLLADEKKRGTIYGEESKLYEPVPDEGAEIAQVGTKPPENHRHSLLLVEDNQGIREYLQESLSKMYEVFEAADGNAGLQVALEHLPDLVICDISMPGMDGLELTRVLKTRVETSHIPVILLTARTSLIYKISGLENGADDYITKPFNMQLLQVRIHNLIESRLRLREKWATTFRSPAVQPESPGLTPLDDSFLDNTTKIILQHIENPDFSVDDLAHMLLMNRKQVYRKIKALTDQTPNELIRSIRLRQAAELLRSHRYTVAEVTYKVGFQDLKYFRERFREFFGVSPSAYGD